MIFIMEQLLSLFHFRSLVLGTFIFTDYSSYSSFFYIAFIAERMPKPENANENDVGECGGKDCMLSLAVNLAIIFGTQVVVGNMVKYCIPFLTYYVNKRNIKRKCSGNKVVFSEAEEQYLLNRYDAIGTR